jgi:hypothetical protein
VSPPYHLCLALYLLGRIKVYQIKKKKKHRKLQVIATYMNDKNIHIFVVKYPTQICIHLSHFLSSICTSLFFILSVIIRIHLIILLMSSLHQLSILIDIYIDCMSIHDETGHTLCTARESCHQRSVYHGENVQCIPCTP